MNIAVCDDNRSDLNVMEQYLARIRQEGNEFTYRTFESGTELLQTIEHGQRFDVFLLDIFLRDENGVNVARIIRESNRFAKIVFVTSSPDFALEGYEVFATGYLVKPVDAARLREVLTHAMELTRRQDDCHLIVKHRSAYLPVPYQEICYVESFRKRLLLHLLSGENIEFYDTLESVHEKLSDKRFLRCHQSVIVNMDNVIRVEPYCFVMPNDERADITKRNYARLKNTFINYTTDKVRY